jgi:hypothetical protein
MDDLYADNAISNQPAQANNRQGICRLANRSTGVISSRFHAAHS